MEEDQTLDNNYSQNDFPDESINFSFKELAKFIGPGFLVCMAYLDPGNLSGDLGAGLSAKYGLLWVLLLSTFFGFLFQVLAAKLGVVTGNDMSTLCRKGFRKRVSLPLWLMTEIAIIGSDIQEVLGSAIALKILFDIPYWLGILITIIDSMLILLLQYKQMKQIENFFILFVSFMGICFLINLIQVQPDYFDIFKGTFIPIIPPGSENDLIALIGCIIMPHNLFLHSSLVQTRQINRKNKKKVKQSIYYIVIESALTLFMSFLINLCVICTFAYYTTDDTKDQINLETAGLYLDKTFGNFGKYIWALGLLASGQCATISGTMAGQFVMEGFLDLKVKRWKRSLITRAIAIVPALLCSFSDQFLDLNQQLNILQAIQLPFALIPLMKFSLDKNLMKEWKIGNNQTALLLIISTILIFLNIQQSIPDNSSFDEYPIYIFLIIIIAYISLIIFLMLEKIKDIDLSDKKEYFVKTKIDDTSLTTAENF